MKYGLIIVITLQSSFAYARAGAAGSSGFRAKDIQGFCVPEAQQKKKMTCDKGSGEENIDDYVKDGYCESIRETLEKPCVADLVEKLRKRFLDENNPDESKHLDLRISCTPKAANAANENDRVSTTELAKDPKKFKEMIVQFMAMNGVLGSDQDVCAGVKDGPKNPQESAGNEPMGILKLKSKDMNDEKYSCGCKFTNEDDSGAADGHRSMVCGTYMALYWADKDGTLFDGGSKKKDAEGKPTVKGAARIFPWLEDNNENGRNETPEPIKLLNNKFEVFCDAKMGGKVNTRDEAFRRMHGGSGGNSGADAER